MDAAGRKEEMMRQHGDYEWVPLSEAEIDEMTGVSQIRAKAAEGDPIAALLLKRLAAAQEAMAPEIEKLRVQIEREWYQRGTGAGSGLSLLLGD
jgi:hypothetical protein